MKYIIINHLLSDNQSNNYHKITHQGVTDGLSVVETISEVEKTGQHINIGNCLHIIRGVQTFFNILESCH